MGFSSGWMMHWSLLDEKVTQQISARKIREALSQSSYARHCGLRHNVIDRRLLALGGVICRETMTAPESSLYRPPSRSPPCVLANTHSHQDQPGKEDSRATSVLAQIMPARELDA